MRLSGNPDKLRCTDRVEIPAQRRYHPLQLCMSLCVSTGSNTCASRSTRRGGLGSNACLCMLGKSSSTAPNRGKASRPCLCKNSLQLAGIVHIHAWGAESTQIPGLSSTVRSDKAETCRHTFPNLGSPSLPHSGTYHPLLVVGIERSGRALCCACSRNFRSDSR